MYYITIDCGTTNSRVYVVDEKGTVLAKATKKVGVRNTSMTGSNACLREGLHETIREAIRLSGLETKQIRAIFSSGMITSEIGLYELPHMDAPCGIAKLAQNLMPVPIHLTDDPIPVFFVRGLKNPIPKEVPDPFAYVGNADFMRGEETQMIGLMAREEFSLPGTAVMLSSCSKFMPINRNGEILGSLTSTSGQLREAILAQTFVGKSVERQPGDEPAPENYFDPSIVTAAADWIQKGGLVRGLMFPRFLDVLLDTKWYARKLFFEALIAAEDLLCIDQLHQFDSDCLGRFLFIGVPERCRLYEFLTKRAFPEAQVQSMTDLAEIDQLSIVGILKIAAEAGVL